MNKTMADTNKSILIPKLKSKSNIKPKPKRKRKRTRKSTNKKEPTLNKKHKKYQDDIMKNFKKSGDSIIIPSVNDNKIVLTIPSKDNTKLYTTSIHLNSQNSIEFKCDCGIQRGQKEYRNSCRHFYEFALLFNSTLFKNHINNKDMKMNETEMKSMFQKLLIK